MFLQAHNAALGLMPIGIHVHMLRNYCTFQRFQNTVIALNSKLALKCRRGGRTPSSSSKALESLLTVLNALTVVVPVGLAVQVAVLARMQVGLAPFVYGTWPQSSVLATILLALLIAYIMLSDGMILLTYIYDGFMYSYFLTNSLAIFR